jgi:DnaJ-class molecular chaperone
MSGVDDAHKREEATRKFQTLGRVYSILSDKNKRAVYDETGIWWDTGIAIASARLQG